MTRVVGFGNWVALGVVVFTTIVPLVVVVIINARAYLVGSSTVTILVNDKRASAFRFGDKLLEARSGANLLLRAACGGNGICGQRRVRVLKSGRAALLTRRQVASHGPLARRVTVKHSLRMVLRQEVFGIRKWPRTVRGDRNVDTCIKELVLGLDPGETRDFRGRLHCNRVPSPRVKPADIDVDPPFDRDWIRHQLPRLVSRVGEPVTRAYLMANYADENGLVTLNVRFDDFGT